MSDVSESFSTKNEPCERIAQVAQQKWANARIAGFFEQIAHSLVFFVAKNKRFAQKTYERIPNPDQRLMWS